MSDLMLDVGQAHELKMGFRRSGYSNSEIKRLCEGDLLRDVRQVLLGCAVITKVEHIIDCNTAPYVPDGWEVEEHQAGGQFRWDPSRVGLHLPLAQSQRSIQGHTLREELVGRKILNANVLDYLLVNTYLIPEEWKRDKENNARNIFFWGTIYRRSTFPFPTGLFVRGMAFSGSWHTIVGRLDGSFFDYPTVIDTL